VTLPRTFNIFSNPNIVQFQKSYYPPQGEGEFEKHNFLKNGAKLEFPEGMGWFKLKPSMGGMDIFLRCYTMDRGKYVHLLSRVIVTTPI